MFPSASRADVLARCQWWARPDVAPPEEERSIYSRKGTALHAMVENGEEAEYQRQERAAIMEHDGNLTREAAEAETGALPVDEYDEVRGWFAAWQASPWSRLPWRHEVAFGWSADRGAAEIGRGREAYASAPWAQYGGTVDLLLVEADGTAIVADIKTGFQPERIAARDSGQLRDLAVMVSGANIDVRRVRVVLLDVLPEGVTADDHTYSLEEINDAEFALAKVLKARDTAEPTPNTNCGKCPARAICPAVNAKVDALVTAVGVPEKNRPLGIVINRDTVGDLFVRMKQAQAVIDALEPALKKFMADTMGATATASDGRVIKRLDVEKSEIDFTKHAMEAREVLEAHGLAGEIKVRESLTWGDVEAKVGKEGRKKIEKELDAVGALRTYPVPQWRVGSAKKASSK